MKKLILVITGVLACLVIVFITNDSNIDGFRNAKTETQVLNKSELQKPNIQYKSGTIDRPYARDEYEKLRTESPRLRRIPFKIKEREKLFMRNLPKSNLFHYKKNGRAVSTTVNFESRGPINVGGRTRALAFDVSDPSNNTILAGGVSGGMWRTVNQGTTWTRTTTPEQFPSVVSIIQDTRTGHENVWFYGTGEIRGNSADGNGGASYRGDGIYKSVNEGQSWEVISSTSDGDITNTDNPFRFVHRLAIDTSNNDDREIYAAVIDGIVRTTDDFETYEVVLGSLDASNSSLFTEIAVTPSGRLYATLSDENGTNPNIGIWTSPTGDVGSWTEIEVPQGSPTSAFQRTSIGISPSNEDIVYFFRTEDDGDLFNLYVYNHSDQSIVARPQSALPLDLGGPVGALSTQNSYDQYVRVHPTNSNIVFLGAVNLYRSTNGFTDDSTNQWISGYSFQTNANDGVGLYISSHPDQHEMVFFPDDPSRAVIGNDGGITMTNNILKSDTTVDTYFDTFADAIISDFVTVDWNPIDTGYMTSQFYTVAINQIDAEFPWIVGGMQDNSTHISLIDNPEESWGDVFGGDGAFTQITHNSLIVSAQFAQAARISIANDGTEGDGISPPASGEERSRDFLFVNPILADPVIPNKVFVAARGKVFYTYDVTQNPSGSDWQTFGEGIIPGNHFVTAMGASVEGANKLVFATRGPSAQSILPKVYRVENSNDPSSIVTDITQSNLPGGYINCIAVNPRDENHIILVYSNYDVLSLFSTTDGGDNWVSISGNLEENPNGSGAGASTRWLEILPNGEGNIYLVGTSSGLYQATELNGNTTVWTQIGEETIGNTVVDMLDTRPIDGFVVASTHGKGVYQTNVEVPLQANIYFQDYPCVDRSFTILANLLRIANSSEFRFTYEWFADGQLLLDTAGNPLDQPGISGLVPQSTVSIQARVTNEITGEQSLSNTILLEPNSNSYCDNLPLNSPEVIETKLTLYPNPSSDRIAISGMNSPTPFNILDASGKVLMSGVLTTGEFLDINALNDGHYFMVLDNKGNKKVLRFIKQ